ncbi:CACTA en-spm transposon protein [Cucumis melo var. makuwa]|uniref:CACTA en-spm transposon protein n=1 Tax=Cucumis melo var. makuwa TaxID=1194695 RepID=A0A5D3BK25_CUCMM|nr:CACTA en-spm transposon protein [Cucumis melo var. makuwa]
MQRFTNTIALCVKDTFPVHYLKWANVLPKYIEVVKVLQALTRFVEHQMFISFKEFRGDCHRHFKKSNQGLIRLLDRSSLTTIVEGPSCLYNDNMSSLNNESKSTLEGPQALFGDEICDTALGRQPGYLKGVDLWGYGIRGH